MQTLRLVGIHEDGEHLLLADQGGSRFQIPLDDALRAAVRRDRLRLAGSTDDVDTGPMRPREVQGLIRTGVPLDEVAERAGWDLEKVRRYEPPIRAERNFIAAQAQALPVRDRSGAATLGERVAQRLTDRGVDSERVGWDSWKETDAAWKVICVFPAGGRERRASWRFSVVDRALIPADDEARWLGEDEHGPTKGAPAPSVPKPTRSAAVYDVEAEGGVAAQVRPRGPKAPAAAPTGEQSPAAGADEAVDLVSVMRERAASRRRKPKRTPAPTDTPISTEDMPDDARPVEHLDLREDDGPPQGSHADPAELDGPAEPNGDPGHDPVTGTRDLFDDLEAVSESWETRASKAAKRRTRKRGRREAGPPVAVDEDAEPVAHDDDTDELTATAAPTAELAPDPETEAPTEPETDAPAEPETSDADKEPAPGDSAASAQDEPETDPDATEDEPAPEVPDRQRSTRKGRPSVPSWDDIMFGSRRED